MPEEVVLRSSVKDLQLYQKETPIQVFSCEFGKDFKNTFFYTTLPVGTVTYLWL